MHFSVDRSRKCTKEKQQKQPKINQGITLAVMLDEILTRFRSNGEFFSVPVFYWSRLSVKKFASTVSVKRGTSAVPRYFRHTQPATNKRIAEGQHSTQETYHRYRTTPNDNLYLVIKMCYMSLISEREDIGSFLSESFSPKFSTFIYFSRAIIQYSIFIFLIYKIPNIGMLTNELDIFGSLWRISRIVTERLRIYWHIPPIISKL